MFNFHKSKKDNDQDLVNQVVGGQSVLFKIFREVLEENPDEVKRIELTYFALSAFTFAFLRFSSPAREEKEATADHVANTVLKKSVSHAKKNISIKDAVSEYQQRYGEYESLISEIFTEEGEIDSESCTTLTMHIYESVMGKSARGKMIDITFSSSLVAEYIVDNIEFVQTKN